MTLPPMFNALAADDELFRGQGFGLVEAWEATGTPVEFHYYQSGGHGFGSYQRGVPADHWFDPNSSAGWPRKTCYYLPKQIRALFAERLF